MALLVYNGTNYDTTLLGTETISTANTNLTTTYQAGANQTAPNTTNKITGVYFFLVTIPSAGNNVNIDVRESGVSKITVTCNNADLKLGWNYARFTTPYQFTTTAAGAYTAYIKVSTSNSGAVARSATIVAPLLLMTYDSGVSIGASDDVLVMGFQNSGLTAKSLSLSGTGNVWGSYTDKSFASTTVRSLGCALQIGNGGTVTLDNTVSTTLKVKGNVLVTVGGVFDMRANVSDISKVSTLEIDSNTADGDHGICLPINFAGQFLATGMTVSVMAQYSSGTGTTGTPVTTVNNHNFKVNDEVVFGGATDYLKNEVRYITSIPAPNQMVLSSTIGGADTALTQTHSVNSHISNMTRNSIIKPTNTARGWWLFAGGTTSNTLDLNYVRGEYANCLSGRGIQLNIATSSVYTSTIDGYVHYDNSAAGRTSILVSGSFTQTFSNIVLYNTKGSNFAGQSGIGLQGAVNKIFNGVYHYASPSSTTNCAAISLLSNATSNTFNEVHSYGANAVNSVNGYAIGILSSFNNTFNDCSVNAARGSAGAVRLSSSVGNVFNNCNFGTIGTNTVDVAVDTTASYVKNLFSNCSFSSATLISNYISGLLEGSDISFFEMDGNVNKHRWYNNHGSFWSSGSGLTETTVRTASSLALAIKPEDATNGAYWEFLIPAVPSSQCGIFGYAYRNGTFSSGTFKVELFLPGSTSADASYTFATTTGSWLPFNISAYYSGSTSRYATVRVTAITATAGAYAFIDDLYDAGTGNKVAGLDVWHTGKPSEIMVATDTSAIPALVWGYSDQTTSANTMGQQLVDVPSSSQNATAVEAALSDDFDALPTAAENADAVWDEALSGHTTSGSAGKTLTNAADDADTAANK